jgi:hypothetical protein
VVVVDTDEDSGQSNTAMVTINFASVEFQPVLDLNGPQQPGRDFSVTYAEGSSPVMVRCKSMPHPHTPFPLSCAVIVIIIPQCIANLNYAFTDTH